MYDCVKDKELGLFGYAKVGDEWMLKRTRLEMLQVGEMKNKFKKLWRRQGSRDFKRRGCVGRL